MFHFNDVILSLKIVTKALKLDHHLFDEQLNLFSTYHAFEEWLCLSMNKHQKSQLSTSKIAQSMLLLFNSWFLLIKSVNLFIKSLGDSLLILLYLLSTESKANYLIIITCICIMKYLAYIISIVAENNDIKELMN